jgi:hypothetical protein
MLGYAQPKVNSSLRDFYRSGPSIWRYIKYDHSKSLDYVEPFSKNSLTASATLDVNKRIKILMTKPLSLPSILHNRALRFDKASRYFPTGTKDLYNYPGDGYVFFVDPFLAIDSHFQYFNPAVFFLYNYLYSYRHLITPPLFKYLTKIRGVLINILYEYRLLVFKDISFFVLLNKICKNKITQEEFEFILLKRLIEGSGTCNRNDSCIIEQIKVSQIEVLLNSYTLDAVKRILLNPNVTSQRISSSINLATDTISLTERSLPYKFSSPSALQKYHDTESERLLRKKIKGKESELLREFIWPVELVSLINTATKGEWYIPVSPIELLSRGNFHKNCIGNYFKKHFSKPVLDKSKSGYRKTLILFSDEAEAEFQFFLKKDEKTKKIICTHSWLIQCRTKFNKEYLAPVLINLCDLFKGNRLNAFTPSHL